MSPFPSFAEYFHALWGHQPYPWQVVLADQVSSGEWPNWITLPTGAGKTACLDIAIYALAKQASQPTGKRTAPVRIVFAVNRRIVVDEAFNRAKKIGQRLNDARPSDVLFPLAQALQSLAGEQDAKPLEAYPLRGATFTDNSWARSPFQPTIITTTLDQLGSRLLFRGYGVSDRAQPLHAALMANDALLILDEAHTSKAFSQTLEAIAKYKAKNAELSLPFAAVQLTATPPADAEKPFGLTPDDEDEKQCPDLVRRLTASKPTSFRAVPGAKGAQRHAKIAKEAAAQAAEYLKAGNRRILIVVNRVATAVETEAELKKLLAPKKKGELKSEAAVGLLTGRLRPLDRLELVASLTDKFQLDRSQPTEDVPQLVLVATQCVEVGADYDFDALITELAPLDSLRQRFGRLNRSGRSIPAPATILAAEESIDKSKPDALYAQSLVHTWQWLQSHGTALDFGIRALKPFLPVGDELSQCLAPAADAPILLPAHLDLLCQTSPKPHVEPEVGCYIHGLAKPQANVSVLFRSDLDFPASAEDPMNESVAAKLEAAPPLGTETAEVPIYHLKKWLLNKAEPDSGGDGAEVPEESAAARGTQVLVSPLPIRWRNGEAAALASVNELRPGDVIVLACGVNAAGLIPLGSDIPTDQFEPAHLLARDRLCVRLGPAAISELMKSTKEAGAASNDFEEEDEKQKVRSLLQQNPAIMHSLNLGAKLNEIMGTLANGRWVTEPYGDDGLLARYTRRIGFTAWPLEPEELGTQGDGGGPQVNLSDHNQAVSERAARSATELGATLIRTFKDAGFWHDWGKADPRFQAMLHGVPLYALGKKPLLAKSQGQRSKAERDLIAKQAELPKGFRHELISTMLLMCSGAAMDHPEADLLFHLIASHHGYCRPLAPPIQDKAPESFEIKVNDELVEYYGVNYPLAHISSGVAERFWKLTRRFGWWGLPYLELLLRLADQQESARIAKSFAVVNPS